MKPPTPAKSRSTRVCATASASRNRVLPPASGKAWRGVGFAARRDRFRLREVRVTDCRRGHSFWRRRRRRPSGRAAGHLGRRQLGTCGRDDRGDAEESARHHCQGDRPRCLRLRWHMNVEHGGATRCRALAGSIRPIRRDAARPRVFARFDSGRVLPEIQFR
jgi:hypothetical protein